MSTTNDRSLIDPAWRSVPKGKSCFLIWRIEQFEVKTIPKDQYGNFYSGDSYIILSVKETRGRLEEFIHFWLGGQSSQDERGCAAIKAVELDDYLGGAPIQQREVEGSETAQFLQYFPKGVRYMRGGVASGFNHVTKREIKTLYHVKGKHHCRVREVPLEWASFNDGDVFLLDLGQILFVWIGKEASRTERLKGMETARKLRDERGGRAIIRDVESTHESQLNAEELALFNAELSLKQRRVKPASEGGSDEKAERSAAAQIKLFVCREEGGTLKVQERKVGPLFKDDLDSNDSFIIDNGVHGIWVWNGKNASKIERQQAMRNAEAFAKKKGYPPSTPITRVCDGGEPYMFRALFKRWQDPNLPTGDRQYQFNNLAAETQMVDDGSGEKEVYRVERDESGGAARYELVPVAKKYNGQFFGGDCYVIVYKYLVHNRQNVIIYFWQGRKSTQDEKGASAYHAQNIDHQKYGGHAVQVRVLQGKEPPHFLAIFRGEMIIFEGGHSGWGSEGDYRNPFGQLRLLLVRGISSLDTKAVEGGKAGWGQTDETSNDGGNTVRFADDLSSSKSNNEKAMNLPQSELLLHVRGTAARQMKAVQVDLTAESLNSNDVFVLFAKQGVYIWAGKGSTGDEREMAKQIATIWTPQREHILVVEGQERDDFWSAIGGKKPYANDKRLAEVAPTFEPRLFQASNASGRFVVDEVCNFTQDDLVSDDVMILDALDNVYVWIGDGANKTEKQLAQQAAIDYIKSDPTDRDPDTPIFMVKQGYEPPSFTGFFGAWDNDLWNKGKTWEELKAELGHDNTELQLVSQSQLNGPSSFGDYKKYPYETLVLHEDEGLPNDVDATKKEMHLLEDDFARVLGMTPQEFQNKPKWKQNQLKKDKGLF